MRNYIKALQWGVFIVIVVCFFGCKKPKNGNVTLQFQPKYGNQFFGLDTFNTDPAGRVVQFLKFEYLLSHITLVKTDNSTIEISPVNLIVYNLPGQGQPPTYNTITASAAAGSYKGIIFWCGIDSNQNNYSPNNIAAGSALSDDPYDVPSNTMYWDMASLFRFEVLEGSWGDSIAPIIPNALIYHVGGNSCYHETQLNGNFSVNSENTTTLNITLDVEKIFYAAGDTLNIVTEPATASTDFPAIAAQFATNFSQAFTLNN